MISLKVFLLIFATAASVFLILSDTLVSRSSPDDLQQILATEEPQFSSVFNVTTEPPDEALHECTLPKLDPWDPTIKGFLNAHKDPLRNCRVRFVRRSRLKDGVLLVNQTAAQLHDGEKCFFRCLLPTNDWSLKFEEWLPVGANGSRPQCDVFDVQCTLVGIVTYKFLHVQIHEQPPPKEKPPAGSPDVHIVLLDSVSTSQFTRSMPLTTHFLRTEMDAVFFPYANKIGLNSRPNAYGFLIGERAEVLPANPWGKGSPHGRSSQLCKQPLDKENVILYDYRNRGYRTLMSEDWATGIFNWPNCVGFASPPANHFMKPFANAAEWNKTTDFSNSTYEHENRTLLGSSLFHPLPQPRNCESLHIPFHYCLCQHKYSLIKNETIAVRVAELAVAKMNKEVARSEYRQKCAPLSVDREHTAHADVQEFEPQGERRIFRVNFRVQPSGGLYDAFAEMTGTSIRLISNRFPRHDRYAVQAKCIPENFIRNYCFCSPKGTH
ncbi:hypothetical protein M3Y99_01109500 [Aphelenchoides fujianensis]|nr:hypothetical protein M3Y99_01109500 [Aphelenchoides fujianensis]